MALARITGRVLGTEVFRGTARSTGQPFSIHTAIVLVGDRDTARVGYEPTEWTPRQGDEVDVYVRVGVYRNEADLRYVDGWQGSLDLAAAAASSPSPKG